MKNGCCAALSLVLLLTLSASAQPFVDGSARDPLYGDQPLLLTNFLPAVQDTQTGYGDALIGRPGVCTGSELDAAYGVVYGDMLYLVFAGNFESNGNHLEIFFDSKAGGQQSLSADNPATGNLLSFSPDPNDPNSLTFANNFEADYYVSLNVFGDPATVYVDYAELYVDAGNPGAGYYAGAGETTCAATNGALTGADPNAPVLLVAVDNSNVEGVDGGFASAGGNPGDVITGIELGIPLSAIGNPTSDIKITAWIGSGDGAAMSNQVLGGIAAAVNGNLAGGGESDYREHTRQVDLNAGVLLFHAPIVVPITTEALGACCVGTACSITTEAGCNGTYLGDNVSCDGNPCDPGDPAGRCCIDDGFSGTCLVTTAAECAAEGGTFTVGEDCSGCPCLLPVRGACCLPTADPEGLCEMLSEAECTAQGGNYVGDYTMCEADTCALRACCIDGVCYEMSQDECWSAGGGIFYENVLSCDDPNFPGCGFSQPHVNGEQIGWNIPADSLAMTEDPPNSNQWVLTYQADPNQFFTYKITNGENWDGSVPGSNAWLYTDPNGLATVLYDGNIYDDGWVPETHRLGALPVASFPTSWNVVGNFQDGQPGHGGAPDWDNGHPDFTMTEVDPWLFEFEMTGLAVGTEYEVKCVATGTWDAIGEDSRNINADAEEFEITDTSDTLKVSCKPLEGIIKVEVIPAGPVGCPGDSNCDGNINWRDIDFFVAAQNDNVSAWVALHLSVYGVEPTCPFLNNDIGGPAGISTPDGTVSWRDIDGFVALQNTTCP